MNTVHTTCAKSSEYQTRNEKGHDEQVGVDQPRWMRREQEQRQAAKREQDCADDQESGRLENFHNAIPFV